MAKSFKKQISKRRKELNKKQDRQFLDEVKIKKMLNDFKSGSVEMNSLSNNDRSQIMTYYINQFKSCNFLPHLINLLTICKKNRDILALAVLTDLIKISITHTINAIEKDKIFDPENIFDKSDVGHC